MDRRPAPKKEDMFFDIYKNRGSDDVFYVLYKKDGHPYWPDDLAEFRFMTEPGTYHMRMISFTNRNRRRLVLVRRSVDTD